MKGTSLLLMLVLSVMLIALASALVKPAAAKDPVIVGVWRITSSSPPSPADDVYYIYPDGTAKDYHGGSWDTGSWSGSGNDFVWRWNFGTGYLGPFVDTVHVEPDGNHITYYNQYGYTMTGVRVADSVSAEDSGFPIVPVAVGVGIAAVAASGAAAYYFLIAKHAAESAAGATGATGGSASVDEKTKEVAFLDRVTRAFKNIGKTIDNSSRDMGTSQPLDKGADGVQQNKLNEVLEKVQDQTKLPEKKFKEIMPRDKVREMIEKQLEELKMKSQETQEVADSGESGSNTGA